MIEEKQREEVFAEYILTHNCTIRNAASFFGYSKSTVHNDISKKLKKNNYNLYKRVKRVLENNFLQKHIRGGNATKMLYKNIKKNTQKNTKKNSEKIFFNLLD